MTVTVIRRDTTSPTGKIHYLANSSIVDGGANVYDAYCVNNGATSFVRIARTAPNGTTVDLGVVQGPEGSKVDGVALVQSGRDLHVRMTAHNGDLNTTLSVEVLQGQCVPYGASGPQLAQAGAFVPTATGGGTVDIEQLKAAVREVLGIPAGQNYNLPNAFVVAIGNMKPKAIAAIEEAQVLRVGSNADEKYSILRHEVEDGSFTGCTNALNAAGADGIPDEPTMDDGS